MRCIIVSDASRYPVAKMKRTSHERRPYQLQREALCRMNIQQESRTYDLASMRLAFPSSKVGKALIYGLGEPVEPQRPHMFLGAIGQQGAESGWWIFGASMLSIALLNLVIGWLSDNDLNWSWYWSFEVYALLAQLLVLWGIWYTHRDAAKRPDGLKNPSQISVRSLRRSALAGDDSLVPPISDQGGAHEAPSPVQRRPLSPYCRENGACYSKCGWSS